MKVKVCIDEQELKKLVVQELERKLGDVHVDITAVRIMVKSKQNWKSEWEIAEYKAEYETDA